MGRAYFQSLGILKWRQGVCFFNGYSPDPRTWQMVADAQVLSVKCSMKHAQYPKHSHCTTGCRLSVSVILICARFLVSL